MSDIRAALEAMYRNLAHKITTIPRATTTEGTVESVNPLTVKVLGESSAAEMPQLGPAEIGQRGEVLSIDSHRVWLGAYGTSHDTLIPWTIPNRQVTIGPDGDFNPVLELQRSRPAYLAGALMYLAANSSTTELGWAIQDNGVTQATLRLTKNGLLLQDNVGAAGSRYFAYQPDLAALQNRVTALEKATQRGTATLTIPAGATTTGFVAVTFPTPFTTVPSVVAGLGITSGSVKDCSVYVSSKTATGFSLRVTSAVPPTSGAAVTAPVDWIATTA